MSLLALLALVAPPSADSVSSSALTESLTYKPGKPVTVALKLELEPQWHVYWRNPGDSGVGTAVEWTLPKGWKAGPLRYPTPEKISLGAGYGFSYGYEHEVAFLADLTPPAGASGNVKITADMAVLACRTDCMPADQTVSFTLSAGDGVPAEVSKPSFTTWRSKIPTQMAAKDIKLIWASGMYTFKIPANPALKSATKLDFFPGESSLTNSEKPVQATKRADGSWKLTVPAGRTVKALPKELPFLVVPLDAKGQMLNAGVEFVASGA